MTNTFQKMDAMYGYQRYVYDATRRFYLLGRDRLVDEINIYAGQTVADIGCGTGRNLEILGRRHPNSYFFGIDASGEMLRTARSRIKKAELENVSLRTALADEFDYQKTFGLDRPLDVIYFSYAISMIPTWQASIERALDNLKPDGKMYIVDFYDQRDLPLWFRTLLKAWLRKFHVHFWSELIPFLKSLDCSGAGTLDLYPIARRYAFIAYFRKAS